MQICVKSTSGLELYMNVELEDTIEIVKDVIEDKAKIPAAQIELTYAGTKLEHGRTLKDYAIQPESTLHLEKVYVVRRHTQHHSLEKGELGILFVHRPSILESYLFTDLRQIGF